MASYHIITSTRTTEPDMPSLLALLRTKDATIGIQHQLGTQEYRLKKDTTWTDQQVALAQQAIDTASPMSPQLTAQDEIDRWPIAEKALVLALIDQLNVIRSKLPTPLAAITPAQALAAIRAKAGEL